MSDLISKKALILQVLAQPGGSERTNPEIAREVGCDAKCVRTVRAEIETDALRADNERLRGLVGQLEIELATHKATQPAEPIAEATPVVPTKPRRRKAYVEDYPLFDIAS